MKFLTLTAVASFVLAFGSLSAQALPIENTEGAVIPHGNQIVGQQPGQQPGQQVGDQQATGNSEKIPAEEHNKRTVDQATNPTPGQQEDQAPGQQATSENQKKPAEEHSKRAVDQATNTTPGQQVNQVPGQHATSNEEKNKDGNQPDKRASDKHEKESSKQTVKERDI
ncbi:hypothetical protein INT45_003931 [Circinella minor]|uniref:Uncharacterized protein n=1 Tax=Circinella minor TaxID=1195481 RepID=A0A8H7RY67_9FUNG|nr:hypothetical protein INT45_003931 [Circinella minor]